LAIIEFYNYIKEISVVENSKIDLYTKDSSSLTILDTIFDKYEKVKLYFSGIALIDTDIIQFKVDKNLSFGEKSLLNLYSTFYDFTLSEGYQQNYENYLILLDEGDLGYHPMWKKKYIDAITKTLPIVFNRLTPKFLNDNKYQNHKKENPTIQIIFTTHDPLTLSDIPNSNIIYLKKDGDYKVVIKKDSKTFGANIYNLLKDSFFLENGFMGDFASDKIESLLKYLKKTKIKDDYWNEKKALVFINLISEPIIKNTLKDLYDTKFNSKNEKSKMKEQYLEIKRLNEKIRQYEANKNQ
jgi:hypothetical protein